jgi:hypothetical protein
MGKYKCDPCNYETNRLNDMNKHKLTQKHIDKSNEQKELSQNYPNLTQKLNKKSTFICEFCSSEFANMPGLSRHRKACSNKTNLIKENNSLKKEIKNLKKQLSETKEDKACFKNMAENAIEATKSSMSALAFVTKHYANAPAIEYFTNFQLLLENNEDYSVAEVAISYKKKKELPIFIGNVLIKEYKKDNPANQSMWNTDPSRSSYMVMESVDETLQWFTDKGGVKASKYAVMPILNHMKTDLNRYVIDSQKLFAEENVDTVELLNNMIAAQTIVNEIDNGDLNKEIIKYVSNYFHLDRKKNLEIKALEHSVE